MLFRSVPGRSDTIRVRSIVGRFLEHTRVFYFHNDGQGEAWGSSADFMTRNMFHRVETCFPLRDRKLAARVRKDLETYLVDNCQSWLLQPDGSYLVEGASLLRELNRKLGYRFSLDGPKTLNGLILEHLREIPEPGVSIEIGGHRMEIVQTQDRVVKAVRLAAARPPAGAPSTMG